MTTVSQLVEKIVTATGKPGEDVRARAKRLRQVQLLPSGPRGRGAPHIDSNHAVTLLLAVLAGNPQVRAEQAPRSLWQLRYNYAKQDRVVGTSDAEWMTHTKVVGPPETAFTEKPFGDLLVWIVDEARTQLGRDDLLPRIKEISAWQNGMTAAIHFSDGTTWWYTAQPDLTDPASRLNLAPALTVTSVPAIILAVLADCVNDSAIQSEAIQTVNTALPIGTTASFSASKRMQPLPMPEAGKQKKAPHHKATRK